MANLVQWTADQLLSQLNTIQQRARVEFQTIRENNRTLADLWARVDQEDPSKRASLKAGLQAWAAQQARLVQDFNTAYGKFRGAYNAAASFLRSVGITAPPLQPGLSGLGALPLVPVAIVAAVLIAAAWVAAVHDNNATQRQMLANQASRFTALTSGKITPEEYLSASKADAALAEQNKKRAPGDWTDMVLPALALVAVIVLGPQLLRLMPARRAAV